jgi:guanylate kinase
MKPVIIAIAGLSGSGKTLAANILKERAGVPNIVSFTTRPMRRGETNGVEHFFVSESEMPPQEEMLAYTKFGGCHYWATVSQLPASGKCVYVIDEKGLLMMKEKFGQRFDIRSVYIQRDLSELQASIEQGRLDRDRDRIFLDRYFYDAVIENNYSLTDFENELILMINNI